MAKKKSNSIFWLALGGFAFVGSAIFLGGRNVLIQPSEEEEFGIKNGEFFGILNESSGTTLSTNGSKGTSDITVLSLLELIDKGIVKTVKIGFFSDRIGISDVDRDLTAAIEKISGQLSNVKAFVSFVEIPRVVSNSPIEKKEELEDNLAVRTINFDLILDVLVEAKDVFVRMEKDGSIIPVIVDKDVIRRLLTQTSPFKKIVLFVARDANLDFARDIENFIDSERPGDINFETVRAT